MVKNDLNLTCENTSVSLLFNHMVIMHIFISLRVNDIGLKHVTSSLKYSSYCDNVLPLNLFDTIFLCCNPSDAAAPHSHSRSTFNTV